MLKKSVCKMLVGKAYRFAYPAHNYAGLPSQLEDRRIRVVSIRDTRRERLDPATARLNPTLKRGRWLLVCRDLDRGCERSFYLESMESIIEIPEVVPGTPSSEFQVWVVGTSVYTNEKCATAAAEVDSRFTGTEVSVRMMTASWVLSREIKRVCVET
jgi:hypothetical protein